MQQQFAQSGSGSSSGSSGGLSSLPSDLQAQMAEIERLSEAAYGRGDAQATALLSVFRKNSECIAQSRLILDHSTNQFALHLAASSLTTLLTQFFHTFNGAQTIEIRNYLLNYIANAVSPTHAHRKRGRQTESARAGQTTSNANCRRAHALLPTQGACIGGVMLSCSLPFFLLSARATRFRGTPSAR